MESVCKTVKYAINQNRLLRFSPANNSNSRTIYESASPLLGVCVNKIENLLALATETSLQIFILDEKSKSTLRCIHTIPFKGKFVQLLAHPLARTKAGFVLATSEYLLNIYAPVGQEPVIDQVMMVDELNINLKPVKFEFGNPTSPLGQACLYTVSEFGDVYQLFPFLGPEVEMKSGMANLLAHLNLLDEYLPLQETWDDVDGKLTLFKRESSPLRNAKLFEESQTITPYPEFLYEEKPVDLLSLSTQCEVDVLALLNANSLVFLAKSVTGIEEEDQGLTLLKCIKFRTPAVRFIGATKTHVIVEGDDCWLDFDISDLNSHLDVNSDLTTDDQGKFTINVSKLPKLVALVEPTRIQGLNLDGSLEREWSSVEITETEVNNQLKKLELADSATEKITFESTFPHDEFDMVLSEVTNFKEMQAPTALRPNLKSLMELENLSYYFLDKFSRVYELLDSLQARKIINQRALMMQLQGYKELKQQYKDLSATELDSLKEKIGQIYARSESFDERIKAVRQAVIQSELRDPRLKVGEREAQWFKDLNSSIPETIDDMYSQIETLRESLSQTPAANNLTIESPNGFGENGTDINEELFKEIAHKVRIQGQQIGLLKQLVKENSVN